MNVLLTGATGFLGGYVQRELLHRGHVVHAVVRRSILNQHARLREWRADRNEVFVASALPWGEIDRVVHLAASGVKASNRQWDDALKVNVIGTMRLFDKLEFEAARRPPILLTRTFYEDFIDESPALRTNPYIITKQAAFELARLWQQRTAHPVMFTKIFQIFGPGDDPGNVLSYAASQIVRKEPAVFGSGRGLRDWLHAADAATAIVSLVESGTAGEWDIGSGILRSIREMVETLAGIAGAPRCEMTFDSSRDRGDADLVCRAENLPAGWVPALTLENGLRSLLSEKTDISTIAKKI